METDHERLRDWAGAYTIGALDAGDRRDFEAHLRSCRDCQAQVGQLAAIGGLLAQVDPAALHDDPDPAVAAAIERRARAEISGLVTSRRRWQWLAAGAVAACIVAVVTLAWPSDRDDTVELVIGGSIAEATSIRAEPKGWGTELHVELAGLPDRTGYQLWTVDADGGWIVAATWGPTPSGGAIVTGASSAAFDDLSRILVTSDDRSDVIVEATVAG